MGIPFVAVAFAVEIRDCKNRPWRLIGLSSVCLVLSFSCWLADKLACETVKGWFIAHLGFYIQLHAWWHTFISLSIWLIIMTGSVIRLSGDKKRTEIRGDTLTGF